MLPAGALAVAALCVALCAVVGHGGRAMAARSGTVAAAAPSTAAGATPRAAMAKPAAETFSAPPPSKTPLGRAAQPLAPRVGRRQAPPVPGPELPPRTGGRVLVPADDGQRGATRE
ncbi:hypothetical protein [Streptomyces sp. NBC_01190]|uniref:hypothetical protein n=1 Tax=Streptomyces sp. NBC_01190 TaxID=2903767 RepID=UPI0038638780|nr:hypothetical protein OG519_27875 [Streptomyces sp. NBC_01190]